MKSNKSLFPAQNPMNELKWTNMADNQLSYSIWLGLSNGQSVEKS